MDVQTPETNLKSLVRRFRAETTVPILLFLPREAESLILAAYEQGVDEVIVGSISPKLFQAKIAAWQRRSSTVPTSMLESFQVGNLRLDPSQRQFIKASGEAVKLTNLEYRLLHLLMSHPGQVLESSVIIARMWGADGGGDHAMLKNVVYRVRRKIEPDPANPTFVQLAAGEGYQFVPPATE